ncbi:MAG TPA: hypothetical protein VMV55_00025 [Methanoregula sp.]|nr:hypothetical protein [Methanoregula sp.]
MFLVRNEGQIPGAKTRKKIAGLRENIVIVFQTISTKNRAAFRQTYY